MNFSYDWAINSNLPFYQFAFYTLCVHCLPAFSQDVIDVADLKTSWQECNASRQIAEWEIAESYSGPDEDSHPKGPDVNIKFANTQFVWVETFADGKRNVKGLNPDYRFELTASPDTPFRLQRLFSTVEVKKLRETIPEALDNFEATLLGFRFHNGLLFTRSTMWPELVESGGFRLLSSSRSLRNGTPVVEISFECVPELGENSPRGSPIPKVRNGTAVLYDKDKYFLPLEAGFTLFGETESSFSVQKVRYEYVFDINPVPQVKELVLNEVYKGKTHQFRYVYKQISVGKPFNDKEFRLTAFDIREPKGPEFHTLKASWPWWLKITIGGIVFVGTAALFKRTFNKKKG